jgi:DNA-binding response OmpR family regulator
LIIIADDDELVVDIVRAALEARGHIVGALPSGARVSEVVELKRPDLLILDCSMPDISGVTVLRNLRASAAGWSLPVLMLTSRTSEADEKLAISAGVDEYMRKPVCPDKLVAWVEKLLDEAARPFGQSGR